MSRTFLPLALIALVLAGAWLIWPQAEPRTPADRPAAAASPAARSVAGGPGVESAAPERERVSAAGAAEDAPPPTRPTRLVVRCVTRAEERPIAGVRVRAADARQRGHALGGGRLSRGRVGEELLTGPDGRAEFDAEPGIPLAIRADDLAHLVSLENVDVPALAPGETREVLLVHDAGEHARLCGLVVARESGAPVADAEVGVDGTPRTRTDAGGRFELDFAAHLPPWIRVEGRGFAPAIASAGPGHETPDRARRIELLREATLEIALTIPEGEARVRVELLGASHELSQEGAFTSTWRALPPLAYANDADASGVCRFAALPPGVRLDAQVVGSNGVLFRSAEPIVLQPGERKRLEWDLRGSDVVGHVYEADGRPGKDVALWLLRGEAGFLRYVDAQRAEDVVLRATSGADGSFRLRSVSPGTWRLAPAPTDEIAGVPQEVVVEPGAARVVVDVRLARGLFVRGRLVAPDGTTGVQGFVSSAGPIHVDATTDAQGAFVLGPLGPGTFALVGAPYGTYLESAPLEVTPPADGVVLRSRPGAEVSGRVVDELGQGVQASITVGSTGDGLTITRTQPDGAFRLDGFAPGRYALFASTSDGRAGLLAGVQLAPGSPAADLQVVLAPGASVRVRYAGRGVGDVGFRRDGVTIGGDGLEGGRSLTQVVPPGRVTVECVFPGREARAREELELVPGETREVVFEEPATKPR